jgi:hypothetical protein
MSAGTKTIENVVAQETYGKERFEDLISTYFGVEQDLTGFGRGLEEGIVSFVHPSMSFGYSFRAPMCGEKGNEYIEDLFSMIEKLVRVQEFVISDKFIDHSSEIPGFKWGLD